MFLDKLWDQRNERKHVTLVLHRTSDQNIVRVKTVLENLFVFGLLTYATFIHPKVSHEFKPLWRLHLEHGSSIGLLIPLVHSLGSFFLVVLVRVIPM